MTNKPNWWFGHALAAATQSLLSRPEPAKEAVARLRELLPGVGTENLPGLSIRSEFLGRLKQALQRAGMPA